MTVATAHAEWALHRLAARTGEYLDTGRTPVVVRRHALERMSTRDANTLVDLVAIAESFCVARLATVGVPDPSSWKLREKAWLKRSVDLATACPEWSALMGFVEARNAIQHGMGHLTDRQLGKYKKETLAYVSAAAIRLNGDALLISGIDVRRCERVCVGFIRWLDGAAPEPR